MKLHSLPARPAPGHALIVVLVFLTVGLMVLAATMGWTATNSRLIDRNNTYWAAVAAAEAATEKVMAELAVDYSESGAAYVQTRLSTYASRVPLTSEHAGWARYEFSDGTGTVNATFAHRETSWESVPLISQYEGLRGYAATFRVRSNARDVLAQQSVSAGVDQSVQLATIPLFQFAIFYNLDLEIHPGPNMTVGGRVHSNRELYSKPGASLVFNGSVTAAGNLINARKPGDPTPPGSGTITFNGEHDGGVNTLNMPLGVENTPDNVRQIVERPPGTESASSSMGRQRYYNKSDLVITIYDTSVTAHGPVGNASSPTLTWGQVSSFVRTNVSFFNKREGKTVRATEIDVAALRSWSAATNPLRDLLGRDVNSIWIEDARTQTTSTQPGIRLVNGQELPPGGLTVATPDPLYVKGHYNAPSGALGTSNTSGTRPAAFIADAITVLSGSWADGNSSSGLSSRTAANTTVNAAFLAGIVETATGSYSGGVENFPRFLENWDSRTLTYNGSMIVMFPSRIATGTWKGTGSTIGIYNPPTRNWNFDVNFSDPTRLPPGTPEVRAVIRGNWQVVSPST